MGRSHGKPLGDGRAARLDVASREPSIGAFAFGVFGAVVFCCYIIISLADGGWVEALISIPFAVLFSSLAWRARGQPGTRRRLALPPASEQHHRYVGPKYDLDAEAGQVLSRADRAMRTIWNSEAFKESYIDSERLSVHLRDRRREIAEKLAALSKVRAEQRDILSGADVRDPEFIKILNGQRHAQDMAAADIERIVRRLEKLADQVTEADGALQKARTMEKLAALNDSHMDLVAQVDHSEAADAHEEELLSSDLQSVIAQANEAIRKVSEAANDIIQPGE